MADYATIDDVTKRYNPIISMLGTSSLQIASNDVASIYIRDAQSIINGYLASRYVIPLNPEPLLTDMASDIAIYRILEDRLPRTPDWAITRYTNVMSMLSMLRDGYMQLTASSQSALVGGDNEAWSNSSSCPFDTTAFKRLDACCNSWDHLTR